MILKHRVALLNISILKNAGKTVRYGCCLFLGGNLKHFALKGTSMSNRVANSLVALAIIAFGAACAMFWAVFFMCVIGFNDAPKPQQVTVAKEEVRQPAPLPNPVQVAEVESVEPIETPTPIEPVPVKKLSGELRHLIRDKIVQADFCYFRNGTIGMVVELTFNYDVANERMPDRIRVSKGNAFISSEPQYQNLAVMTSVDEPIAGREKIIFVVMDVVCCTPPKLSPRQNLTYWMHMEDE